jgi:HK97 family phage prohead protease
VTTLHKPLWHKSSEASTTVTDLGEFEALAAAYTVDRQDEQITRGAFSKTIRRWRASGKMIPLHWNHSGSAADIIGWIDPVSMQETDEGLYVKGKLDLERSEVASEAWRSIKANAVALSFGYTADGRNRSDGVRELYNIDLYEISIVPAPANPDTRFLSTKSAPQSISFATFQC